MKIEIDTELLDKVLLTPSTFVYLYLVAHKIPHTPSSIISPIELNWLEKTDWIKISPESIELREKSYRLFEVSDKDRAWIEFFMEFPMKVNGSGGATRPLRPTTLEAKANEPTKKKYLAVIKNNPDLHSTILQTLKAEVDMRRRTHTLTFMNAIDTWLNQRMWEKYAYLLAEEPKQDKTEGVN